MYWPLVYRLVATLIGWSDASSCALWVSVTPESGGGAVMLAFAQFRSTLAAYRGTRTMAMIHHSEVVRTLKSSALTRLIGCPPFRP
jgi:hypothetical protein